MALPLVRCLPMDGNLIAEDPSVVGQKVSSSIPQDEIPSMLARVFAKLKNKMNGK